MDSLICKNCYRHIIITEIFLLVSLFLNAQNSIGELQRWDERMINEADVWKNLLPYYRYTDKASYWPERKKALMKIIDEFPTSQWVDDALLMMTDEKAVIDNNIDEAILELRKIQENYPNESTIIDFWHYPSGCQIIEAWLMWVPGSLVVRDGNNNVIKTYPFDRDNVIDELELEAITFFEHLEKHPQRTKDVAQYIIALMLSQKGDFEGAIHELEALLSNKNLQEIKTIDYEASKSPHGYLIESVPPYDRLPLTRVELSACNLLLSLYPLQNEDDKLIQLSDKIANEFSFDGWYWFINKKLGNIYAQHNQTIKACEQYQLSIEGIKNRCKNLGERLEVLYEKGFVGKPEDFISWEVQALKRYYYDITEIERLQENLENCYLEAFHVDVGNDTTFCGGYGQIDTLFLGSNLKIENGIPPYSFKWESRFEMATKVLTAGDFLNDTTVANPYIKKNMVWGHLPQKFFLQVTDAENNTAIDSINVNFSICGCIPSYIRIQLNKGDSVFLDAGIPAGESVKYYWEPSYGLSHPDSSATWCKPDSTMNYMLMRVDSFGCLCSCYEYEVGVIDTIGVSSKKVTQSETKCFLSGNGLKVERTNDLTYHLTITTLTGKVLHTGKYNERSLHLTVLGTKPQALYMVTVCDSKMKKTFKLFNQ